MKKLLLTMILILGLSIPCLAGPPTRLIWDESPDADAAGYYIYHGVESGVYPNAVKIEGKTNNCFMLSGLDLEAGMKYYIAVTAYASNGTESGYSNEVTYPSLQAVAISIQDDNQNTIITIAIPNCTP